MTDFVLAAVKNHSKSTVSHTVLPYFYAVGFLSWLYCSSHVLSSSVPGSGI